MRIRTPQEEPAVLCGGVDYEAFTVYTAAIVQKHPAEVNELLAYQLTIIKAAQQYDGLQWRAYDTHFRISAAATGNRQWSRLDTDLYTRFFNGRAKLVSACSLCESTQHTIARGKSVREREINCNPHRVRQLRRNGDCGLLMSVPSLIRVAHALLALGASLSTCVGIV